VRYLLAIFLPPAAVLSCGKTVPSIVNLFLFALAWGFFFAAVGVFSIPFGAIAAFVLIPPGVLFWCIAVLHAWVVVGDRALDERLRELELKEARSGSPGHTSPQRPPA
jgi:uncharacterized membrane protein YqaE (UPF0057 family)